MATEVPIACTLSPTDYRARVAEIAALRRDALLRVDHHERTWDLRYSPDAAARLRRLVDQERTCCAFLHFELHERADQVQLLVTVPAGAEEAAPDLLAEWTGERR